SSGSGWYLIVNESDWEMYKSSYIQLLITILLSLATLAVILILYIRSLKAQQRAEEALSSKDEFLQGISDELQSPLKKIINVSAFEDTDDREMRERLSVIHGSGEQLSEMIGQIISYSNIIKSEKREKTNKDKTDTQRINKRSRGHVILFMVIAMAVNLISTVLLSAVSSYTYMEGEINEYFGDLTNWVQSQKSKLDMFTSIISTNADMLDDYEGTVAFLDRMTRQYPEISAAYMTDPGLEHTVYMNNGWQPDEDWKVEERGWYKDTIAAESGWCISSPYYDEQTGMYCMTFSKRVYDADSGDMLGVFGIDFYMDKLTGIMDNSYSEVDYAFLVDTDGYIINHPYGSYQMTAETKMNIHDLPYGKTTERRSALSMVMDYDHTLKAAIAKDDPVSGTTLIYVLNAWEYLHKIVIFAVVSILITVLCIIAVYRLLSGTIRWQNVINEELEQAKTAAEAAGQAKGRFLAQMSHEIRTPINAVLGMNEMIYRKSDDPTIVGWSDNIRNAGRTLLSMINSILDFSKIEDGKMEIVPVKYETASMINDLINTVAQRATDKGLDLEVDIDSNIPAAMIGDDLRLKQVVINLLTNAVKYTEQGSVTLTMKLLDTDGTKVRLYVEVKDTGIGIRDEDREKLFGAFSRLDQQRNHNIEGTGLGMSIVTALLSMMGSELELESTYGKGSVFSFKIEQTSASDQILGSFSDRYADRDKQPERIENTKWKNVEVLVTDDNSMNLKV
ncbi:MAG: histidine kinase, partial [Oscillospiraceae bacterium]|nr:histidine kinase [Oscillospiraceae bacterium]